MNQIAKNEHLLLPEVGGEIVVSSPLTECGFAFSVGETYAILEKTKPFVDTKLVVDQCGPSLANPSESDIEVILSRERVKGDNREGFALKKRTRKRWNQ